MSDQSCSMYVRNEATYIFPEEFTAEHRHVPCVPVVLPAPVNDSALLGDAVLRALRLAGQSMTMSERTTYDSVVRALGFPTFGRFNRGAKHLHLSVNEGTVTITPSLAERGVWWPAARTFTCALTADAIGSAVGNALLLCTDDGKDQVPPVPAHDARMVRDYPVSFGYKISWLAIHTTDTMGVVDRLGLRSPHAADWAHGVEEGYGDGSIGERGLFVTPAVDGWTFVVSNALPDAYTPEWLPLLAELSKGFGEAQYFGTHRGVNYQAWARAESGSILRAYANGEGGFIEIGEKSAEEIALGFNFLGEDATEEDYDAYDERNEDPFPDEQHVVGLAGAWSIDPTQLDREESQGFGVVGELPGADLR